MSTEPEALSLADGLDKLWNNMVGDCTLPNAAAELRRLHSQSLADEALLREAMEALVEMQRGSSRMQNGVWGSIRMPSDSAMDMGLAALSRLRQRLGE